MPLLRIASCQFPVCGDIAANADYICRYLRKAAAKGADVFHTSEASLSGYAGHNFKSFEDFDWDLLRRQTTRIQELAHALGLWVVLGSAHWLGPKHKPTNCLYLIDGRGRIADRYDKCMCTGGDQYHYSGGRHLVTRQIKGVRVGLAICYDVCYPEIYASYRRLGVSLMLHSFHNAGSAGPSCLDVLNGRQVATRCADNRMWAVANNSSAPYSHWGSFVARPDATIAMTLGRNRAGMLVYDFDKELSTGGWFHNNKPMKLHPREVLHYGKPTAHARQLDRRAKP